MADGRKVWLFEPERMRLGDVMLEGGNSKGANIITATTGGPYSHALLWVGGDFIEAMPEGVRSLSFARVPVLDGSKWLLLRPQPTLSALAELAVVHARQMAFKEYDAAGALRTVIGPRSKPIPTRLFCSQLVVEAYARAGLELLPGKTAQAATPNMLAKSPHLVPTELPLVPSEQFQPGEYPAELLDRSAAYLASPMHREAEINRKLFRAVATALNQATPVVEGIGRPGNLSEALDFLTYLPVEQSTPIADRLLSDMEQLGYFTLLVPAMANMLPRVSPTPYWKGQIVGWEQSRQRHTENRSRHLERYTVTGQELWLRLAAMYSLNADAFSALIEKAS